MTCKYICHIRILNIRIYYVYVMHIYVLCLAVYTLCDQIWTRNILRWHLDFVPWDWDWENIFPHSPVNALLRHDETSRKYVCLMVCECSLIWQMYSKQIQFHSRSMENSFFLFSFSTLRFAEWKRKRECVCGRKHVISKTIIIIFTITFFAIPKYTTLCNVFNSS